MAARNEQEELIFKAQGLTEAIGVLSQFEELVQGLTDRPDDKDLKSSLEALDPNIRDLQTRFEPHLTTLGLFAAQMASLSARLETDSFAPTGGELRAVTQTLANLQSELRKTHSDIERFDKWVRTDRGDLLLEIAMLSDSIANVRRIFEFSNSLRAGDPETEIFRQTVISLLTSAIEELKAPAVNVNRLSGISGLLKRVLVKSVEKQLGDGADAAINKAVEESGKVIDAAKLLPGIERLL